MTASDTRPPSDTEATGWHRHQPGWFGDNIHRDDDPQCSHLTRIPVLVVDSAEARQKVAEALFSMGFEAPWIYADAVFAALQLEDHRTQDEATTRAQELRDAGRLVYPDSPYQVDGIEWNDEETP